MADRTEQILEEVLAFLRFQSLDRLRTVLAETLRDAKDFDAYELSDGSRSQAEVAKGARLSQPTVSRLWARWRQVGVVRDVDGRAAHLVAAADVGIERPT